MVQGNFIGTDLTGTNGVPNGFAGLTIYAGASSIFIGGTGASARNIISGNQQYGMYVSDPGTDNNFVLGNFIGPDVTGTKTIGDGGFGIGIRNGASGNFIGGTAAGAGNLISGNPGFSYGIALGGVSGNVVRGNFMGTDAKVHRHQRAGQWICERRRLGRFHRAISLVELARARAM